MHLYDCISLDETDKFNQKFKPNFDLKPPNPLLFMLLVYFLIFLQDFPLQKTSHRSRSKLNAMTFMLQPSYTKNGPKPNTLSQHHRPAAHTTTAQPYPYINIQILIGKSIERVRYKKEEKLLKRGFWVLGVRFQFWDDSYKIR